MNQVGLPDQLLVGVQFISGQLVGKFLRTLMEFLSSDTMRNPTPKAKSKSRQHAPQHHILRQRLCKCLGRSGHTYNVIQDWLNGTYCWEHSPSANQSGSCFEMKPWICQCRLVGSGSPYLDQGSSVLTWMFVPATRYICRPRPRLDLVKTQPGHQSEVIINMLCVENAHC